MFYQSFWVFVYSGARHRRTPLETLNRVAVSRWSIEQCFQECKSYLGMGHYEARSYKAWHRHMLFVMMAHAFLLLVRNTVKKNR